MNWLLWIDIETDGLDPIKNNILQIASILTDFNMEIEHYSQEYTIAYKDNELNLSDWCKNQHTISGLLPKVYGSDITLHDAELEIIKFLNCHVGLKDTIHIAGNSVYFDKSFIDRHMQLLSSRLDRRVVDVSSISILCKNLSNNVYNNKPIKLNNHTALSDIQESIEELKYYINAGFILPKNYNFLL